MTRYAKVHAVRLDRQQSLGLEAEALVRGISTSALIRRAVDEFLGRKTSVDMLEPPSVQAKPLVRGGVMEDEPVVVQPDYRNRGFEEDGWEGLTPASTGWSDRKAQVMAPVRVRTSRCQCPPGTPLDGQTCTGCWMIR